MSSRRLRRTVTPLVLALVLVACGQGDPDPQVAAGAPEPSPTAPGPAAEPTAATASTTVAPATVETTTGAPSTTTVPTGTDGDPSPSVVAGLSPEDVRAAATAPTGPTARRLDGPSAERLVLPSGATVWRLRIPGEFAARSARVTVSVGSRAIGQGIVASDLGSLVAITSDGTGLVAGAEVSYRWEGSEPTAAGPLGVAR